MMSGFPSNYETFQGDVRGGPNIRRGLPRGRTIVRGPRRGASSFARILTAKPDIMSGRGFTSSDLSSRHHSKSSEYSDHHHSSERYRSSRRSRSPSYDSTTRHRSSRYRSSRSRSRERSRSRSRGRSRSRSWSPTSRSRVRSRSPSWSRSSSHHDRHYSRTPSPGADRNYDHGRNLRYFDVVSRSKSTVPEDASSALSANKRSPSPIVEKQIYYPPGSAQLEASRKESLRITVDNDRFGGPPTPVEENTSTALVWGKPVPAGAEGLFKQIIPKKKKGKKGSGAQQHQEDMGRKWGRDDRAKDRNSASSVPVWMIPKVMNARDMDVFDDDIQSSRISSRATPPPEQKPPRPKSPLPPSRPFMKTEGKPRPEDINIFTNIAERSWDTHSPFLDEPPVRRSEPSIASSLPGLGSDDDKPLRSILRRKQGATLFDYAVKDEPEEVTRFVIPGLGDMDIDDEDKFLYGEDIDQSEGSYSGNHSTSRSEERSSAGRSAYMQQHQPQQRGNSGSNTTVGSSSRPSTRERSQDYQSSWDSVEKSKSQTDVDQAKLESFLKSIGLDIDKQKTATTTSSVSKDAAQRGAQVTQTIMDYYNSRSEASASSTAEKQIDSMLQISKTETSPFYRQPPPASKPSQNSVKQEPEDKYNTFGSSAVHPYQAPAANDPSQAPPKHYAPYPVQATPMPAVPSYPTYPPYEGYYNARYPPPPLPVPQPVPAPLNTIQDLPLPNFALPPPNLMYPPVMSPSIGPPPSTQNWTPPSSAQPMSANRSNLKVIPLQTTKPESGSMTTTTTATIIGGFASILPTTTKQVATTLSTNSSATPIGPTDEIREPNTLAERKKLRQQRDESKAKLTLLMVELERLRKQQGELMRKKQRQKDGHNDPQLVKTNKLISEYDRQVAASKKKLEVMDQYLRASQSLAFVSVSDGNSIASSASSQVRPKMAGGLSSSLSSDAAKGKSSQESASEKSKLHSVGQLEASSKMKDSNSAPAPVKQYRFIDNGDHWCKHCNDIFPLATDLLKHLHSRHFNIMETVAPADRPWATKPKESKSVPGADLTLLAFKGVEFMMPCQAFYCNLCKEFAGDVFAGRNHLESDKHNANYSKFCRSNPNYVKRIQADRAASLARKREESKRKLDESSKDSKSNKRSRSESSSRGSSRDDHLHSPSRVEYRERSSSRDSRKDTYRPRSSSRDRGSSSRDREDSENDEIMTEDHVASTKRSSSVSKSNIRLNLLHSKDKANKETSPSSKSEDEDREKVIIISKPGAKIPIKIKGKGISSSGPPSKVAKKASSSTMTVEQQRTQRILSNMLKKMKHDKAERAEAQKTRPQPLEDFVCISSDGYVEDPKKTREREIAAAASTTVSNKADEENQEKVTVVQITPNLPKEPSAKNDSTEKDPQGEKVAVEEETLIEEETAPQIGPQLPKEFEGDLDSLTNVLTAIPLPPELDDDEDDDDDIIFEKEICPGDENASNTVVVLDEEPPPTSKNNDSLAEKSASEGNLKNLSIKDDSKEPVILDSSVNEVTMTATQHVEESVSVCNELKESTAFKSTFEESAAVTSDLKEVSAEDGSNELITKDELNTGMLSSSILNESAAKDGLEAAGAQKVSEDSTTTGESDRAEPENIESATTPGNMTDTEKVKDDSVETSTANVDSTKLQAAKSDLTSAASNVSTDTAVTNSNCLETLSAESSAIEPITHNRESSEQQSAEVDPSTCALDEKETEFVIKSDLKESAAINDNSGELPLESSNSSKDEVSKNPIEKIDNVSVEVQLAAVLEESEKVASISNATVENVLNDIGDNDKERQGELSFEDTKTVSSKIDDMEISDVSEVVNKVKTVENSLLKAGNDEGNVSEKTDDAAAASDKVEEDVEMKSLEDEDVQQKLDVNDQSSSLETALKPGEVLMDVDHLDSNVALDLLTDKETVPSELDITDSLLAGDTMDSIPSSKSTDDNLPRQSVDNGSTTLTETVGNEDEYASPQTSLTESKEEDKNLIEEKPSLKEAVEVEASGDSKRSQETKDTIVTKKRPLTVCSRGRGKRVVLKGSKVEDAKPCKVVVKSTRGAVKAAEVGTKATISEVQELPEDNASPSATETKVTEMLESSSDKISTAEVGSSTLDATPTKAVEKPSNVKSTPTKVAAKPAKVVKKPMKAAVEPTKVLEKSSDAESTSSVSQEPFDTGAKPSKKVIKSSKLGIQSTKVDAKGSKMEGNVADVEKKTSEEEVKSSKAQIKSAKDVLINPNIVEKSDSEVDIECDFENTVLVPEPPKRRQVAICSRGRGRVRGQVQTRACTVVLRQEPVITPNKVVEEPNKANTVTKAKNARGIAAVKKTSPGSVKAVEDDDSDDEQPLSHAVASKRKRTERPTRGKLSKRVVKCTPARTRPKPHEDPEHIEEEIHGALSSEGQEDIERTLEFLRNLESDTNDVLSGALQCDSKSLDDKDSAKSLTEKSANENSKGHIEDISEASTQSSSLCTMTAECDDQPLISDKLACEVVEEEEENKAEEMEEEELNKAEEVEEKEEELNKAEEVEEKEEEDKAEEVEEKEEEEEDKAEGVEEEEDKAEDVEGEENKAEEVEEEDDKAEEVEEEEDDKAEEVEEEEEDDKAEEVEEEKKDEVNDEQQQDSMEDLEITDQTDAVTEEMLEDALLQSNDEELPDGEDEGDDKLDSDLLNDPSNASTVDEDAGSEISMGDMEVVDEAEDNHILHQFDTAPFTGH